MTSVETPTNGHAEERDHSAAPGSGSGAEVEEDEVEKQMRALLGIGGFDTTKQKKVPGNNIYSVKKAKKTEYRQYMCVVLSFFLLFFPPCSYFRRSLFSLDRVVFAKSRCVIGIGSVVSIDPLVLPSAWALRIGQGHRSPHRAFSSISGHFRAYMGIGCCRSSHSA
jgi:hypothetical protein